MMKEHSFTERGIVTSEKGLSRYSVVAPAGLFLASAAVVIWQCSRFAVLWDASYVLENAVRIAAGDIPYRHFPFPYPPLTFSTQAAIILLFGRAYWHHLTYAAIACGLASVVTFTIVRRLVPGQLAVLLCAPLVALGIYCIVPIPFYDPDCCFVILLILAVLLLRGDSIVAGAACVVPLLIKQNIGLGFLAAALLLFAIDRRWRSLIGVLCGAAVAAAGVAAIFGLRDYIRWTMEFAASRRLPPLADQFSIYNDVDLWWWLAFVVAGTFIARGRWLIAVPFLWIEFRFFFSEDPTEPEINLLRVWPLFILAALIVTVAAWRRERGFVRVLPLVTIGAIHGAFLSQTVWGSTYGIWPLLVILIAIAFRYARPPILAVAIICAVLLHHGGWYVLNNRRLAYVKWNVGEPHRTTLPALRGLTVRGEWLPEFEELVRFAERQIPRDDGIFFLPGEDLFYFATGRRPRFPVLMFDATVNPYSPQQIAALAEERRIGWVIVKQRLQINGVPYADQSATLSLLRTRYAPYARLANYDVYRLSAGSAKSR